MTGEHEVLDLDAIAGEIKPHRVKVGGKEYEAPGDLSIPQLIELQKMGVAVIDLKNKPEESLGFIRQFLAAVFGDDPAEELLAACGLQHLEPLVVGISKWYGLADPGKAPGSSRASRRAGARSKPTSNGSTRSTSKPRASAKSRSGARTSRG